MFLHVVGARPNLPKLAPVWHALAAVGASQSIVDTGQHYDDALYGSLWREFSLPAAAHSLKVGSAEHSVQTARLLERLASVFAQMSPSWVVVYGDVNSTLAASLAAAKMGIPIAHVEAGLRSDDWGMPEEVNRVVTDRLSDLLLAPSRDAVARLRAEGERESDIHFVGNVMVDSLMGMRGRAEATGAHVRFSKLPYVLATIHRPSNVDDAARLRRIVHALDEIAEETPVVIPLHPRTRSKLLDHGISLGRGVTSCEPLPYLDMLDLTAHASAVVTDSGGVQEETTALGIPCFTVRPNTERPVTITEGTNRLVPEPELLLSAIRSRSTSPDLRRPEGWDGKAADRIRDALLSRT